MAAPFNYYAESGQSTDYPQQYGCPPARCPQTPCQTQIDSFRALITPVTGLRSLAIGTPYIEFKVRRKNNTVTLQWEPFEGSVSQTGVAFLSVQQTIGQMPPYQMSFPIVIQFKGVQTVTYLMLDPSMNIQIKFYLNISGSGADVVIGDSFIIPGGSVTWITKRINMSVEKEREFS